MALTPRGSESIDFPLLGLDTTRLSSSGVRPFQACHPQSQDCLLGSWPLMELGQHQDVSIQAHFKPVLAIWDFISQAFLCHGFSLGPMLLRLLLIGGSSDLPLVPFMPRLSKLTQLPLQNETTLGFHHHELDHTKFYPSELVHARG